MNTVDYNTKINKLLSDSDTYTVLDTDNTLAIKQESDTILQEFYRRNYISFKRLKHLTNYKAVSPVFMGFQKYIKKIFHYVL